MVGMPLLSLKGARGTLGAILLILLREVQPHVHARLGLVLTPQCLFVDVVSFASWLREFVIPNLVSTGAPVQRCRMIVSKCGRPSVDVTEGRMVMTAKLMLRVSVFLVKGNVQMKKVKKPVQNAKALMANATLWHVALSTRAPYRRLVAKQKSVRQIIVVDAMPFAAPRRDYQ
mmetsp:Transcript_22872/g.41031  ORF Transcript_22872/g.41031 Transcript_22872/m.41031 type:complete len:173 (+) Transcript_22872:860-1378(+)